MSSLHQSLKSLHFEKKEEYGFLKHCTVRLTIYPLWNHVGDGNLGVTPYIQANASTLRRKTFYGCYVNSTLQYTIWLRTDRYERRTCGRLIIVKYEQDALVLHLIRFIFSFKCICLEPRLRAIKCMPILSPWQNDIVHTGPPHLKGRRGFLLYLLSRLPTRNMWHSSRHPQSTAYFLPKKNNISRKHYLLSHLLQDVFSILSTLSEQQGRHCDRCITRNWCWNCFGVGEAWSQGKSACLGCNMTWDWT